MLLESVERRPESRVRPAAKGTVPSPLQVLRCCLQNEWMQDEFGRGREEPMKTAEKEKAEK